jgi:riboflavin-specific deaminase-like protein
VRRLLPEAGEVALEEVVGDLRPAELAGDERPHVFTNFAITLDGQATIFGRSGPIGSSRDTEMLQLLRTQADAVMIGAGTLRAERYGRIVSDPELRARRESIGLAHDPLAVIVSGRLDLPWDAGLFTNGDGSVVVFTAADTEPPETATPVEVIRHEGAVDLVAALRHLRVERGIRALLCEGGPRLHAQLIDAGLVDELFVTHAPKLGGGDGPGLVNGLTEVERPLELVWLLEEDGELFARYRVARPDEG